MNRKQFNPIHDLLKETLWAYLQRLPLVRLSDQSPNSRPTDPVLAVTRSLVLVTVFSAFSIRVASACTSLSIIS